MGDAVYNFQYCLSVAGGRAVLTSSTEENSASTAYQLQIVDSAVVFCQVVGGVGSVPGEIEKARRKPCFIESFGYESFFV